MSGAELVRDVRPEVEPYPDEVVSPVNAWEPLSPRPSRRWWEEDGVTCFQVTSRGATGLEWPRLLEQERFRLSGYAEKILQSNRFKSTCGVTTKLAVLPGTLFKDDQRTTKLVCAEASRSKLVYPKAEMACLARKLLVDQAIKDMGFSRIVFFHKPIEYFRGTPHFLSLYRGDGGHWLLGDYDRSDHMWDHDTGFAFAAPIGWSGLVK